MVSNKEWLDKAVSLLKGKKVSEGLKCLLPIPYSKGVTEFFANLNGNYEKVILSTGINLVADKIKKDINFDYSYSNVLNYEKNEFKGTYELIVPLWGKKEKFLEILEKSKIKLEEVCFIGDGINDIPCFEVAGVSIAYNPREEEVIKYVDRTIHDFKELNSIL